jgi:hypothetical protein
MIVSDEQTQGTYQPGRIRPSSSIASAIGREEHADRRVRAPTSEAGVSKDRDLWSATVWPDLDDAAA